MEENPRMVPLDTIAFDGRDFDITVAEQQKHVPFGIKRIYWLRSRSESMTRGNHAHRNSHQLLVSMGGQMRVHVTNPQGAERTELLDDDGLGLYIPPNHWLRIEMAPHSVLLCLSSHLFGEQVTTYDFNDFLHSP